MVLVVMIARIGQALHGEHWRGPMAEALGVSYRTLRRWETGQLSVPENVWVECGAMLRARGVEVVELIEHLSQGTSK